MPFAFLAGQFWPVFAAPSERITMTFWTPARPSTFSSL